jgi:hypothetical protein
LYRLAFKPVFIRCRRLWSERRAIGIGLHDLSQAKDNHNTSGDDDTGASLDDLDNSNLDFRRQVYLDVLGRM